MHKRLCFLAYFVPYAICQCPYIVLYFVLFSINLLRSDLPACFLYLFGNFCAANFVFCKDFCQRGFDTEGIPYESCLRQVWLQLCVNILVSSVIPEVKRAYS